MPSNKYWDWVVENYDWLVKWFDDCEPVPIEEMAKPKDTHCQIFIDNYYGTQAYNKRLRFHLMDILLTCTWGKHFEKMKFVQSSSLYLTTMDGFIKLRNRLPLPSDKVGIRYFGEDKRGIRMLRFDPYREGGALKGHFLSDCRLEILNEPTK